VLSAVEAEKARDGLMGGGYSKDIKIIIDAHANTFRLAQDIYF
jgi:hypothetical protein